MQLAHDSLSLHANLNARLDNARLAPKTHSRQQLMIQRMVEAAEAYEHGVTELDSVAPGVTLAMYCATLEDWFLYQLYAED